MAIRRLEKSPANFSDELTAVDIAANSIGASELAFDYTAVKPHIIPGVLYPAVAGKLLDGTTSHGATYGVVQADTRSYYYTDIKGSKPIKDPRIGSHFGSQRHKFKSLQLLEQETATHGDNVYSIDGREWCRTISDMTLLNSSVGQGRLQMSASGHAFEITGYFNSFNLLYATQDSVRNLKITIDNVVAHSSINYNGSVNTPLAGRYVDSGSVVNVDLTATGSSLSTDTLLGIHTIKIEWASGSNYLFGFELIAQDTTSTATKSKVQIPSQDVVSYGKKFTVGGSSAHTHYDPFDSFVNSTSLHSAFVDTATSLGLSTAPGSSASWAISGSNNIRPYNGGRVVRWVDSSGVIKTSVNMMPPNAQNILGTVAGTTEVTTPSATNATYTPIFSDDAIDNIQSEVAKTFHFREFGNGSANGGTLSATYADASMLSDVAEDDVAYVMDDGLTSLSGFQLKSNGSTQIYRDAGSLSVCYVTFIGTGIGKSGNTAGHNRTIAQNLPYGTHIYRQHVRADNVSADWHIDGVQVRTNTTGTNNDSLEMGKDFTIHQPKLPPIPEDAVIISDYMLMADFVPQTTVGEQYISKGIRRQNISRDVFFNDTNGDSFVYSQVSSDAKAPVIDLGVAASSDTSTTMRIPSFGINYVQMGYQVDTRSKLFIDTTDNDSSATKDNTGSFGSYAYLTSSLTLGVYKFGANSVSGQTGNTTSFDIASPIHTSSHYQTFETPFLHELVGGDRNLEQTNLVVTADGKTWDEVTRDVSYIGGISVLFRGDPAASNETGTQNTLAFFEDKRGTHNMLECHLKNWAIAYDRIICLKQGQYRVTYDTTDANAGSEKIFINGVLAMSTLVTATRSHSAAVIMHNFVRGDYITLQGAVQNGYYMKFVVEEI